MRKAGAKETYPTVFAAGIWVSARVARSRNPEHPKIVATNLGSADIERKRVVI